MAGNPHTHEWHDRVCGPPTLTQITIRQSWLAHRLRASVFLPLPRRICANSSLSSARGRGARALSVLLLFSESRRGSIPHTTAAEQWQDAEGDRPGRTACYASSQAIATLPLAPAQRGNLANDDRGTPLSIRARHRPHSDVTVSGNSTRRDAGHDWFASAAATRSKLRHPLRTPFVNSAPHQLERFGKRKRALTHQFVIGQRTIALELLPSLVEPPHPLFIVAG